MDIDQMDDLAFEGAPMSLTTFCLRLQGYLGHRLDSPARL